MKKSSLILLSVLVVLTVTSLLIYKSKSKLSTVDDDARNFKFKDTASITKIFIADKEGRKVTVERSKNGWQVNNKYKCRSEAILNLLEVIKLVEVKNSVPKLGKENVIKFMSSNALKVEIYCGDELVKQYYVGHEPADSEGSYMLLTDVDSQQNYKEPFVCFIPGFVGYLQPRFITNENEWRDRVVLNYSPPQLKEIKIEHVSSSPDSSFTIQLSDANTYQVKNFNNKIIPFDVNKMHQYLMYLQNISYEVLITGKNKKLQDSLNAQKPFCKLTITTSDLISHPFIFYRKQFLGNVAAEKDFKYLYDPDRCYLKFDNEKEWALVQYFVFGKLLITPNYFLK